MWDVNRLKRVYTKHFTRDTLSMIVCKLSSKILIAFESEIVVMDSETYSISPNFSLKQKAAIKDMKLS